jgi:nucleoside 2-deoxyribosyltransferase
MHVYIAAPLFNREQVTLIENIEDTIRLAGHTFFSPRTLTALSGGKILNAEDAARVKHANKANLYKCDALLAVLEFRLPPWHRTYVWWSDPTTQQLGVIGPLNIPDAGVSWELGYFEALQQGDPTKRAACYSAQVKRPNVMLVQGHPLLHGLTDVVTWLNDPDGIPLYTGDTV